MDLSTDYVALIKDVGFPIAVASFVLFKLNGKVGELKDAVIDNTKAVSDLASKFSIESAGEEAKADLRAKTIVDTLLEAIRSLSKPA